MKAVDLEITNWQETEASKRSEVISQPIPELSGMPGLNDLYWQLECLHPINILQSLEQGMSEPHSITR